jgi:glycosyltransferase involved in cell wall biosynthesis
VRNLILGLARIDQVNRYVLLAKPADRESLGGLPETFSVATESSPVYSLRELVALSWQIVRRKLDLYHSTHYVLPAWIRSRVVVTIHDIIHLLYPEFLPSDLLAHFDVEAGKIEVVYNGVADVFRTALGEDELTRRLTALGLARPYLLFVGNPKPHKNLDTVVKAYARARRLVPFEAPLVCVGGSSDKDLKIRQRAQHLGLSDKVRLLGRVAEDELAAIYQGATLFLYPTLYEGFGLPVVEAMASGLPVITSNTSALKEVAEGYAHLVNPLDVEAMAKGIAQLMSDADRRATLAALGRQRADDFRWDEAARQTLAIYRATLAGDPRAVRGAAS